MNPSTRFLLRFFCLFFSLKRASVYLGKCACIHDAIGRPRLSGDYCTALQYTYPALYAPQPPPRNPLILFPAPNVRMYDERLPGSRSAWLHYSGVIGVIIHAAIIILRIGTWQLRLIFVGHSGKKISDKLQRKSDEKSHVYDTHKQQVDIVRDEILY